MKKSIVIMLSISSGVIQAQKARFFTGVSAYLDTKLDRSSYVKLGLGTDYRINHWLVPELEANVYFGSLQTQEKTNAQDLLLQSLDRDFRAFGLAFVPKVCFGGSELKTLNKGYFQILPRYSLTKIVAKGNLFSQNPSNPAAGTTNETFSYQEVRHSIGLGVGYYTQLSSRNSDGLAFNLYYDNINFGNAVSRLKYSNTPVTIKNAFGIGIQYYIGFSKKK
ncbi:hypothetical protein FLBR109950_09965 [Flavobacterium branchiophilum]|uniref:Outer membrane protein beta-barrel domain-containing protein n=1 Tax=Flavobacterium branchiophilum (strain FL-15) TaxID=1034807 RepID=G2Z5S3_FLABF|nr:hypothetical protein [Flavobacterium branchiophilum]CCB70877.1 Protein of unknown function precursor [Flavobacterium branchiophilum FL-15]